MAQALLAVVLVEQLDPVVSSSFGINICIKLLKNELCVHVFLLHQEELESQEEQERQLLHQKVHKECNKNVVITM